MSGRRRGVLRSINVSQGGLPKQPVLSAPDETREFPKGRLDIVRVGGVTIGRARYEPGWRWSEHVGPSAGAARCGVEHVGMVLEGVATVAFEDGRVIELRPGQLFHVPAVPHDSWVVGDAPYVSLHFLGADRYAAPGPAASGGAGDTLPSSPDETGEIQVRAHGDNPAGGLTPYWFPVPGHAGIGVTAASLAEAAERATAAAVARGWPLDPRSVQQNVDVSTLDPERVVPHMADIRQRGVWFPRS
ncbi:MAG TPA: cupin domain-containing protein [Vicinamibacteria bacterium]|nr:cupin domain-containing protein [Vicinamibacteria bacterium]